MVLIFIDKINISIDFNMNNVTSHYNVLYPEVMKMLMYIILPQKT